MIKSLSTVVDSPDLGLTHVVALAAAARQLDASLLVTMLTAAPMMTAKIAPFGGLYLPEAELRADAREDMMRIRTGLAVDDGRVTIGGYYGDVSWLARELRNCESVVDLTVIGAPDGWEVGWLRRHVIETLLMSTGTPLLLLGKGQTVRRITRAVLAWKPSGEAVRAARDMMALAEPGAHIDIITVAEDAADQDGSREACPIADYLRAHGFVAECHFINGEGSTDDQLQDFARTRNADVLAIGAYAHSRVREILLGGVTRSLIDDARVPVLMSR